MDLQAEWLSIIGSFPVSPPLVLDITVVGLSARLQAANARPWVLYDRALRKSRRPNTGLRGRERSGAETTDTEVLGGWVEHDAPAVREQPGRSRAKGKGNAP